MNKFLRRLLFLSLGMSAQTIITQEAQALYDGSQSVQNALQECYGYPQDENFEKLIYQILGESDLDLLGFYHDGAELGMIGIYMIMWEGIHRKDLNMQVDAAKLYMNRLKELREEFGISINSNESFLNPNFGIHSLIVNILNIMQAYPETWKKIVTIAQAMDNELIAGLQERGICLSYSFKHYSQVYKGFDDLLENIGEKYQPALVQILKDIFKDSASFKNDINFSKFTKVYGNIIPFHDFLFDDNYSGISFSCIKEECLYNPKDVQEIIAYIQNVKMLDLQKLAQAYNWYDNFIEQCVELGQLKPEMHSLLYQSFAYIKANALMEWLLRDYQERISAADKILYKKEFNAFITRYIKAMILFMHTDCIKYSKAH